MSPSIDPRFAAAVTQNWVVALTEALCASTPMLSWHWRGNDDIQSSGGSAFLIRTPAGLLGITAGHVLDGFIARRACDDITATLGGLTLDHQERLIARGNTVDIATFRVDEADLELIGFRPLQRAWPPAIPVSNGIVLLAGWPGKERVVGPIVTGGLYTGWGEVGVSNLQLTIRINHEKGPVSPIPGVPLPPPGFEFGGIISEGKPGFDYIVAARADVINDDGHVTG